MLCGCKCFLLARLSLHKVLLGLSTLAVVRRALNVSVRRQEPCPGSIHAASGHPWLTILEWIVIGHNVGCMLGMLAPLRDMCWKSGVVWLRKEKLCSISILDVWPKLTLLAARVARLAALAANPAAVQALGTLRAVKMHAACL